MRTWQVAEVGSMVALRITRSSKSASSGSAHSPPGEKQIHLIAENYNIFASKIHV